jgi:hypothetical protein
MWIYEYRKFDGSGFLPFGPYDSQQEAADAMRNLAERFGETVKGPIEIEQSDVPFLFFHLI